MVFIPDAYQKAIHQAFIKTEQHLFIDAKAGAGKTTTLLYLMKDIPENKSAISLAFNKKIQLELQEKIPSYVCSMTLNSYGYAALREREIFKIERWKVGKIIADLYPRRSKLFKEALRELVGLHKNTLETDSQKLVDIYNVDLMDQNPDELYKIVPLILKKDEVMALKKGICDYDDQLWLPAKSDWELPTYDYVFVDETQDLNNAQIELVFRAAGENGRIIAVGDPHQSVYAFRGADPQSIPNLVARLKKTNRDCEILPLSISYRCAKEIIKEAKTLVPSIEASPNAIDGTVEYRQKQELLDFFKKIRPEQLKAGGGMRKCMLLCRSNSPLIEWYLFLTELGLPVCFQSSLIAGQLQQLVAVHSHYGKLSIGDTCRALYNYARRASQSISSPIAREHFFDKILTLIEIIQSVPHDADHSLQDHYKEIDNVIQDRFTTGNEEPSPDAILVSTVHRAKGLEALKVMVIRPDLLPHPLAKSQLEKDQEENIKYVAITRAARNLYFILSKEEEEKTSLRAFFEN